jgi:hypothetical protein
MNLYPTQKTSFFLRLIGILIFAGNYSLTAQNPGDSLNTEIEKKWIFDFQIDQRTSFLNAKQYSSNPISIKGFTMGWTYKDRLRIGWGGYFVNAQASKAYFIKYSPVIEQNSPNAKILNGPNNTKSYLVQNSTQMYYITPSFEFVYFKSKWLDMSIPFEIGAGYCKIVLNDYFTNNTIPSLNKRGKVINPEGYFFPALIGAAFMVNLSRDVGFSTSVGYRKILKEIGVSQDYDGLYYQFGLQLFPANIKKDLKNDLKKLKAKRKKRREERQKQN